MTIVVGSVPTLELQRYFPNVTRAGYARICPRSDVSTLPQQELNGWLGLAVEDSVAWAKAELRKARASMGPTLVTGKLSFLAIESTRYFSVAARRPTWASTPNSEHFKDTDIVLCRENVASRRYRYFLGQVKGGRVVAEAHSLEDVGRLQFGLLALLGKRCTIIVDRDSEEGYLLHIPTSLPRPERQLVLALAPRDTSLPPKTYRVSREEFLQPILAKLKRLGCEVVSRHG